MVCLHPGTGKVVLEIIIKEKPKTGLILMEEKVDRYVEAKVLKVDLLEQDWEVDDIVLIDRYSGHSVEVDGKSFVVMKSEEVISKIDRFYIRSVCKPAKKRK